ncbi:TPA: hypothetical protein ACH3X1_005641 [Trebouxia sp. C0004]
MQDWTNISCHRPHVNQVHLHTSPQTVATDWPQRCSNGLGLALVAVPTPADRVCYFLLNWHPAVLPLDLQSQLYVCTRMSSQHDSICHDLWPPLVTMLSLPLHS